jgi:hypothetical protein
MSYDKKGLGVAEMTFVAVNYPSVWKLIDKAFDDDRDKVALDIARDTILAHNAGLIEVEL